MTMPPLDEAEAFGISAAEASAAGLPVVASGVGGLTDIVIDGETGMLTPPGDASSLALALQALDRRTETGSVLSGPNEQAIRPCLPDGIVLGRSIAE